MWRQELAADLLERDKKEQRNAAIFSALAAKRAVNAEKGYTTQSTSSNADSITGSKEDEISSLYSRLSVKEDKLQKAMTELGDLRGQVARLTSEAAIYKRAARDNEEKAQLTKDTVKQLHDDILAYQIELNMANQKLQELQQEHQTLVQRWLDKAAQEADQLNDANRFLHDMASDRQNKAT